MTKHLPWFRFYTEAIDDEKLGLLAFEDRWHFVALLCLKGKGVLDDEPDAEMLARKVALKMGLTLAELEKVAARLARMGLIDKDTFQPCAWDARQMKSDSSAERVQAYRERQKQAKQAGNVTVTAQEEDIDTDTDKQIGASAVADSPPNPKKPKPEAIPWQQIVETFNATLTRLPKVRDLTTRRKTLIRRAWQESSERQTAEFWAAYWQSCEDDPFLNGTGPYGNGHENWRPDFDYLIRSDTVTRVVERVVHGARIAA